MAIFASALSAVTIAGIAAGTINANTLSPVGLWIRADEGTGLTTADASGNGHTGTLTNGPTWSTDVPAVLATSPSGAVHHYREHIMRGVA